MKKSVQEKRSGGGAGWQTGISHHRQIRQTQTNEIRHLDFFCNLFSRLLFL